MRGAHAFTGLFLFIAGSASAPPLPKEEFEVATIKPFTPNPNGWAVRTEGGPGTSDLTRIKYLNMTFKSLLSTAYGVEGFMISGPASLDERWIIEAALQPGATREQVNQMLQSLLLDRFRMTLHRETRRPFQIW